MVIPSRQCIASRRSLHEASYGGSGALGACCGLDFGSERLLEEQNQRPGSHVHYRCSLPPPARSPRFHRLLRGRARQYAVSAYSSHAQDTRTLEVVVQRRILWHKRLHDRGSFRRTGRGMESGGRGLAQMVIGEEGDFGKGVRGHGARLRTCRRMTNTPSSLRIIKFNNDRR